MNESPVIRSGEKRESVMLRALIRAHGARIPTAHRVRNLSLSGARIDDPGRLRRGDSIRVTIGQVLDIDAMVMWTSGASAGIRFEEPIDVQAARRSRSAGIAQAGWMDGMNDAYRRR